MDLTAYMCQPNKQIHTHTQTHSQHSNIQNTNSNIHRPIEIYLFSSEDLIKKSTDFTFQALSTLHTLPIHQAMCHKCLPSNDTCLRMRSL